MSHGTMGEDDLKKYEGGLLSNYEIRREYSSVYSLVIMADTSSRMRFLT